jgi:hypothetical protein
MRLGRWQRIGVVLSFVWIICASVYSHRVDVNHAESFAKWAYHICTQSKAMENNNDLSSCIAERDKNLKVWMEGSTGNMVFTALVPIPLFWLSAFVLVYLYRIQVVGFRAVVQWKSLTRAKKAGVVLCGGFVAICVLLGIGEILELYVDTKVPVSLSPVGPEVYSSLDGSSVNVQGTWTRGGMTPGSVIAYPLQTSYIECNKESRQCTESRAYVVDNLLATELVRYDIKSWTDTLITFGNESYCSSEQFRINLASKTVDGEGHSLHDEAAECNFSEFHERNWTFQLANGFDVYWNERKQARPTLLWLFQALLG